MDIKKVLPAGHDFHRTGPGNFEKKLKHATISGEFKNLRDNQESIIKTLDNYVTPIRRGNFGRLRQREALGKIRQLEGARLTLGDKKDIKEILKYLGDPSVSAPGDSPLVEQEIESSEAGSAAKLEEKMAARQAVEDRIRPGKPSLRVNRSRDKSGVKVLDSHYGLVDKDSHGNDPTPSRHLDSDPKERPVAKNNASPHPTPPPAPHISLMP